jgi:hypothetical protein
VNAGNSHHGSQGTADAKSRILSLARQLLTGQIGVIAASRQLSPLRHEVETELAEALVVFTGIDSETDTLPIGEVRQHWSAQALELKDREIADAEDIYRDTAIEAATRLVHLLELPS